MNKILLSLRILLELVLALASLVEGVMLEVPFQLQFCSSSAKTISFPEAFAPRPVVGNGEVPFPDLLSRVTRASGNKIGATTN